MCRYGECEMVIDGYWNMNFDIIGHITGYHCCVTEFVADYYMEIGFLDLWLTICGYCHWNNGYRWILGYRGL